MRKILKWIGVCIIALPLVAIIFWVGFEFIGAMVNSFATSKQTRQMQNNIRDTWQNVSIIDTYSETGNTSGTGNHVDMLSVVLFRVDADIDEVIDKMSAGYEFNATDCWIGKLDDAISFYQNDSGCYSFLDDMELPDDTDHCFIFVRNQSAPFEDNIVGH